MPKSLQQLQEEEAKRFDELCHGFIVDEKTEEKYPIVKVGEVVLNIEKTKDFLLSSLQSAHELGKAEVMESMREKIKVMFGYPCGCMNQQIECTHNFESMHALLTSLTPSSDITKE